MSVEEKLALALADYLEDAGFTITHDKFTTFTTELRFDAKKGFPDTLVKVTKIASMLGVPETKKVVKKKSRSKKK